MENGESILVYISLFPRLSLYLPLSVSLQEHM